MSKVAPNLSPSVRALRPWQRFLMRVTLLFGDAVFAVFALLGAFLDNAGVASELNGLKLRLRAMVVLLAGEIPPQKVEALRKEGEDAEAIRSGLRERAIALYAIDPDVRSVYVPLRADEPGLLRFPIGYDRLDHNGPMAPGLARSLRRAAIRAFSTASSTRRPEVPKAQGSSAHQSPAEDAEFL